MPDRPVAGRRARSAGPARLTLAGLVLAGAVAGCAQPPSPASSPGGTSSSVATSTVDPGTAPSGTQPHDSAGGMMPPNPLQGTRWTSTAVQPFEIEAVPDVPVTVSFADGRVSAAADCNTVGAPVSLEGGVLVADDPASTMLGCTGPAGQLDGWLAELLGSRPTWTLEGETLTISGDVGTLVLARQPDGPDTVAGHGWRLDGLVTSIAADGSVSWFADAPTAWIRIEGSELTLNTGCNGGGGTVEVGDGTLRVSGVITTQIACDGTAGEVDREVRRILDGSLTTEITGDGLLVWGQDGTGLQFVLDETVGSDPVGGNPVGGEPVGGETVGGETAGADPTVPTTG